MVAVPGEAEETVAELLEPANDCIFTRTIRDYSPLDRSHLIVWGPAQDRAYLVTVAGNSPTLQRSWKIAFRSRDSRLCPYGGDAILIDDPIQRELRIISIRRISADAVETLEMHFDRGKAEEPPTSDPADIPEAEVEELDEPIPDPH